MISFDHGYPPECWEEGYTWSGGDVVSGSIVGVTLDGGIVEVRRRLIFVTKSLTKVIA